MSSTEFTIGATNETNKILAFDSSGEIAVTQELELLKEIGLHLQAIKFMILVKDTSTNIFIVTAHTSSQLHSKQQRIQ